MLSVVIPTLNAAALLASDTGVGRRGGRGGGRGRRQQRRNAGAGGYAGARVCSRRRADAEQQLAAGVAAAHGEWLLLLHADTRLAPGMARKPGVDPARAGYFRFALDSDDPRARRLERLVAWRCRVFALPYGDQGLLIHRDLLAAVGGIRPLPLMEDVDLVRRLGRRRLMPLDATAVTSAEKWQRQGWYRRSLRNLACLTLYFAGVPPRHIARLYR